MDIPINVDVLCDGESCGRSTCLIINPIDARVTHLVVIENDFPYIERLIPVALILDSSPNSIQLHCDKTMLSDMAPFKEADFISAGQLDTPLSYGRPYLMWPYVLYEGLIVLEHEQIPAGEVVIRRGTLVKATDGRVGKVDEFLVDPQNDLITHLVLREGHLWGQKDVTIPVSEIERIAEDAVYLKVAKQVIASLPTVPLRRKWK